MIKMTSFILKCSLLVTILFIGVLIGMQKANEGMVGMKGYNDQTLKSPINVKEGNGGNVEASVLGKNVSSHNLDKKKEHLQKIKTFNFFSSLGKILTTMISSIIEKMIDFVSSFI
jgi:hypothetical protein